MSRKSVISIDSSPDENESDAPALPGTAKIRVGTSALESSINGGNWASIGSGSTFGWLNVKDFGAVGDGVTDDSKAFEATLAAVGNGTTVFVPPGTYRLSRPIHLMACIELRGVGGGGGGQGVMPSKLLFDDGLPDCIYSHRYNTSWNGGAGDGSIIRNLQIVAASHSSGGPGIRMFSRATVEDCFIAGHHGDGIRIVATYGGTGGEAFPAWQSSHAYKLGDFVLNAGQWYVCKQAGTSASSGGPSGTPAYPTLIVDNTCRWGYIFGTNANGWAVNRTRIQSCDGSGVWVSNGDSNAGSGTAIDIASCSGYGIYDNSFLNNTWSACQVAGCTLGSYVLTGAGGNQRSLMLGCYNESDGTPGPVITLPSQLIGGLILGATGTGMIFQSNGFNNPIAFPAGAQLARTIGGTAGQEYLEQWQFGNDGTRFYLKFKVAGSIAGGGVTDSFVYDYANTGTGWGWGRTSLAMQSVGDGALPRRMLAAQLFTVANRGLLNEGQRIAHSDSPTTRAGSWLVGDVLFRRNPTPTGGVGWVVTTSGTNGTYTEGRTATATGTTTVVLSAATDYVTGLGAGDTLLINGVTARVTDINVALDTLTMSAVIPAGSGLAIAYVAPVFTEFGPLFQAAGNSTGTPGNATLNTRTGRSAIAIGANNVVITNSLVTATSLVFAQLATNDATLTQILRCVPAAGSFTITGNANATAATNVSWRVEN